MIQHFLAYMPPDAHDPENPESWVNVSSAFQEVDWEVPEETEGVEGSHMLYLTAIGSNEELSKTYAQMSALHDTQQPICFAYSSCGAGLGKWYKRAGFLFVNEGKFGVVGDLRSVDYELKSIGSVDDLLFRPRL